MVFFLQRKRFATKVYPSFCDLDGTQTTPDIDRSKFHYLTP